MIRIAHIINPVNAAEGTELHIAQPIVFQSMQKAALDAAGVADVKLYSTQYPEDHIIIPEYLQVLPDLHRSVMDTNSFETKKKLPLIADILQALYDNSDADYLVFTNSDIILMPYFYQTIAAYIKAGHDSLIINRRRIPRKYDKPEQLPLIYAEVGMSHPGFDCFVFHRGLYEKMLLGHICIGIPFIGVSLAHNLMAFSQNLKILDKEHLTVHLGMEVMPARNPEYYWHNRNEFNKILKELKPHLSNSKLPYAEQGLIKRVLKRALNPSVFTGLSTEMEIKGFWNKLKYRLNNIRFQLLQRH